jgi:adenylate cyclase
LGDTKNTHAAEAALKIDYSLKNVLIPPIKSVYKQQCDDGLVLQQTVGIDVSSAMAVRSVIRNNNDLVWVGRAPNIAAKLSANSRYLHDT